MTKIDDNFVKKLISRTKKKCGENVFNDLMDRTYEGQYGADIHEVLLPLSEDDEFKVAKKIAENIYNSFPENFWRI